MMEEVSRESYLAHSGLKPTIELQPIYAKYSKVLDRSAFDLVANEFRETSSSPDEHRSARVLLEWELEGQVARELAPLEEREVAWENAAMLRLPEGREISYQTAPIESANVTDRAERLAIDEARAKLAGSEHAPIRLEYLQREKEVVESMDIAPSYNATFEAVTGIALDKLAAQCSAFLRETEAMWDDTLRHYLRARLGLKRGEATRADALALFRAADSTKDSRRRRWSRRSGGRSPRWESIRPPTDASSSISESAKENGHAPSARRFAFRTKCISSFVRTAVRTTTPR
jgi:hypothetical protein